MTFCDHPVSYGPRVSFGFNTQLIRLSRLSNIKLNTITVCELLAGISLSRTRPRPRGRSSSMYTVTGGGGGGVNSECLH